MGSKILSDIVEQDFEKDKDYQYANTSKLVLRDIFVQCPFEPEHQVAKKNYRKHVLKCKKQHRPDMKMKTCPYNYNHIIPMQNI